MAEVQTNENGDDRVSGVVRAPSDAEQVLEGVQVMDPHTRGKTTVVIDPSVAADLTAKDYRDNGYVVDDKVADEKVPRLVVADRPAELRSVVLANGTQVAADDIPTAMALESRKTTTRVTTS